MASTIDVLLSERRKSLGIQSIEFTIAQRIQHDPGCRIRAVQRLIGHRDSHRYALVMFDKIGCGKESDTREEIQNEVEQDLHGGG